MEQSKKRKEKVCCVNSKPTNAQHTHTEHSNSGTNARQKPKKRKKKFDTHLTKFYRRSSCVRAKKKKFLFNLIRCTLCSGCSSLCRVVFCLFCFILLIFGGYFFYSRFDLRFAFCFCEWALVFDFIMIILQIHRPWWMEWQRLHLFTPHLKLKKQTFNREKHKEPARIACVYMWMCLCIVIPMFESGTFDLWRTQ